VLDYFQKTKSRFNSFRTFDLQAKIDQALQQKQREAAAKRFKKPQNNESESEYIRQKNELQQMMGSKGDEASKWLVR
jgi:hypothetical protein